MEGRKWTREEVQGSNPDFCFDLSLFASLIFAGLIFPLFLRLPSDSYSCARTELQEGKNNALFLFTKASHFWVETRS